MFNTEILIAGAIILALVLLVIYVFPYLRKKGVSTEIYDDIKLGLLLFGYAFRDEKIKQIIDILKEVIVNIEHLDIAHFEKKADAVEEVFERLLVEMDILLDKEAIEILVNIAASYLPKTEGAKKIEQHKQ